MEELKITKRMLLKLEKNQLIFFAWLCGVRVLPFINKIDCCTRESNVNCLFDILSALDISIYYNITSTTSSGVVSNISYAYADAAYAAANCAAHDSDNIPYACICYTAAYVADAAYAAYTNDSSYPALDAACEAVSYAISSAITCAKSYRKSIENIIISDFYLISEDRYSQLENDITFYGEIWVNFQNALKDAGCSYWGKFYEDLFASRFCIDEKFKDTLRLRIDVPQEVCANGATAVSDFLENLEKQGSTFIQRETRLVILGSAGSGKTTLARRLNGDYSNPAPDESTHGVDTSITLTLNGVNTHIWDFGGQVIYHSSHRCFISENCVYILVVNARTEDNRDISRIKYWLDTISIYSKNRAKVFIVINESDDREQNVDDFDTLKQSEYKNIIGEIYSFNISKDIRSVNAFKEALSAYIEAIGHQSFGKYDRCAIEDVSSLFIQNKKIITENELESILRTNNIKTRHDQERAKKLFNTLGIALSYDFTQNYILDPYWISHGVYKVIDYLQKNKLTFINTNKLSDVFMDEYDSYPADKHEYIVRLIEYHKIGFSNIGGVNGLIVPCVSSQFKPKNVITNVDDDNLIIILEREDLEEFPADFFYQLIHTNKDDIKRNGDVWSMWQTGMVLTTEDASALIELIHDRRITITVWGQRKDQYAQKLEHSIDELLKEYHFKSEENKRNKAGKVIKNITLIFRAFGEGLGDSIIKKLFNPLN